MRYLFSVFLILLGACAGISETLKHLDDTMRGYERALRWGSYETAFSVHMDQKRELTPQDLKKLERFKVTGYRASAPKLSADEKKATQLLELRYYNSEYAIERTLNITMEWVLDENGKSWRLKNSFPEFR